ncbi:MAG: BatA domain-containing protein, partial [Planctomycetota bacterium]
MIGFLAAGALAGLASLGWPVYLHLRKRRRQIVQIVPSLVLFSLGRRSSRRPIVEERLLLASRLLLLLFLCLLVAQPYLETARSLPLPRLHEETPADTCVGVLLDDSLTSLHGETGRTRLDLSRRWLAKGIRSLPASTRVVIALTSFPYATRPMTRERALELLELVRPVPRRGRAAAALGALQHTLRGVDGALVVAASRDRALWSDLEECADREGRWAVQFLDTSDRRLPWLIHSVEPAGAGGSGNGWICNLLGEPNAMVGETLVVEANDGRTWRCEIGPGDAERGRISLLLPRQAGPCWFAANAGGGEHPWSVWRFRTEDAAQERCPGGVVVLRPVTRQGLLVDKVITAALLATYPDCRIHHLDPAGPADSMPDVGAIVYVGTAQPGASLAAWFSERFEKGANLLCLPTDEDARRSGTGRALALLPTWGDPVAVKPGGSSRIAEVRGSSADGYIDGLLLKGLRQSLFGCLMPPSFGD